MSAPSYASFNCSLPPAGSYFVRNPPVRGTLDIVWSCLAVLLLSTWEILPLNVPNQVYRTKWKRWAGSFRKEMVWMVITLLAPELTFMETCQDLYAARRTYQKGKHWAREDGVQWTLTLAYFTTLRGLQLENKAMPDHERPKNLSITNNSASSSAPFMVENRELNDDLQPYYSDLNGNDMKVETVARIRTFTETAGEIEPLVRLNGARLIWLRENGWIDSLPNILEDELDDKNKSSGLIQALALMQILWLIIQMITRATKGLSTSQLEFVVVAFAALSLLTRAVAWQRPQGVRTAIRIRPSRYLNASELERLKSLKEYSSDWDYICLGASGVILGAIHFLAWNETFPTSVERLLWRICATLTTCVPVIFAGQTAIWIGLDWPKSDKEYWISTIPCLGLYALARLYIIMEAFRSSFFLPQDAFTATWTTSFPHLG